MIRFASKKLYLVWATTCAVVTGIVCFSLKFENPEGTILHVFGSNIVLGFSAREMAVETMGRWLHTVVPAVIVCSGFSGLVDSQDHAPGNEGLRTNLLRLAAVAAQGILLSQLTAMPLVIAMIRLMGEVAGAMGSPTWLTIDMSGVVMGLQLLLWSSTLMWLIQSNRWLALLGAFGASFLGRICGWVNEWGPDLSLPGTALNITSAMAMGLPREYLPGEGINWEQAALAAAIPFFVGLVLQMTVRAGKRRIS